MQNKLKTTEAVTSQIEADKKQYYKHDIVLNTIMILKRLNSYTLLYHYFLHTPILWNSYDTETRNGLILLFYTAKANAKP